jgi:hypothetical protein
LQTVRSVRFPADEVTKTNVLPVLSLRYESAMAVYPKARDVSKHDEWRHSSYQLECYDGVRLKTVQSSRGPWVIRSGLVILTRPEVVTPAGEPRQDSS